MTGQRLIFVLWTLLSIASVSGQNNGKAPGAKAPLIPSYSSVTNWVYTNSMTKQVQGKYFRYNALRAFASGNPIILNEDPVINSPNLSLSGTAGNLFRASSADKFDQLLQSSNAQKKLLNSLRDANLKFEIGKLSATDMYRKPIIKTLDALYVDAKILNQFGIRSSDNAKIPLVLLRPYLKQMSPEFYFPVASDALSQVPPLYETPAHELFEKIHSAPSSAERDLLEETFIRDMDAVLTQETYLMERTSLKYNAEHFLGILNAKLRLLPGSTHGTLGHKSYFSFSPSLMKGASFGVTINDVEQNGLIATIDPWTYRVLAKIDQGRATEWALKNAEQIESSYPPVGWKSFRDNMTEEAKRNYPNALNADSIP
jgi:hypothetical protein